MHKLSLSYWGALILVNVAAAAEPASAVSAKEPWRAMLKQVEIPCSDGTKQPAMWFNPASAGPKPLLVGLHTWSTSYDDEGQLGDYVQWCINQGWIFIRPQYRGPNNTPDAMGSDRAVQDVVEAVAWARHQTDVDATRIYLIGGSGGGHMAMQMAARHPEIWAGVSAWCGITDIAQWYVQTRSSKWPKYARDIEGALGGSPLTDPQRKAEAWKRSPLSGLQAAKAVPLDINHGIHDLAVPFTHALHAFNAVVATDAQLEDSKIGDFYATKKIPADWSAAERDPTYGESKPIFRKVSGNTRVTVFEGGHDMVYQAALNWLAAQRKGRPVVWNIDDFVRLDGGVSANSK